MTTLDDILASAPIRPPHQGPEGGAEDLLSYGRALIRQGLIAGAQWGMGQISREVVVMHLPREDAAHTHDVDVPAEPEALRSDDQARKMFACMGDLGFARDDRQQHLAFINAVLGEGQHVESSAHLTVSQASRIIGVLVTLPAVIEADARRLAATTK